MLKKIIIGVLLFSVIAAGGAAFAYNALGQEAETTAAGPSPLANGASSSISTETEADQAISEAQSDPLAEGLQANIWYSLTGWRGTTLIGEAGALPVYEALRFSASQLDGASFVRPVDIYAGVKGYEFAKDGKRLWVLWSLDGEAHTIQLFTQPAAVYDVFGAALPADQELNVTAAPVYVEWGSQ